jgi:hypothetical protein
VRKKPNVSHLREFGAPIWILSQGQNEDQKMLPKSKRKIYLGFDNGSNAIKYYNAETCKVLTSHNFHHLNPPKMITPPELIQITPHLQHEGEFGEDMPLQGVKNSDQLNGPAKCKRKRIEEPNFNIDEPRKMRGICTDYQCLNDPFEDEEKDETFLINEQMYTIIAGNELTSLCEAKQSPDWSKWQKSIKDELDMLKENVPGELVQKPPDAVPITNQWTFIQK